MKPKDVVEVVKTRSFQNSGTIGWFGYVNRMFVEDGASYALIYMQGEVSPRLYNIEDLKVIKES